MKVNASKLNKNKYKYAGINCNRNLTIINFFQTAKTDSTGTTLIVQANVGTVRITRYATKIRVTVLMDVTLIFKNRGVKVI